MKQKKFLWWGRLTALRANASPFPYLMQGVFCCLCSFFLFVSKEMEENWLRCGFNTSSATEKSMLVPGPTVGLKVKLYN